MRNYILVTTLMSGFVAGCGVSKNAASTYTLYRNSPLAHEDRVHWATFDVEDSLAEINRNQCMMAARLLNANIKASAEAEGKKPYVDVGFWCERGTYAKEGSIPATFEAEYPTDVKSGPHF